MGSVVTLDEYANMERPNVEFLVDGLIPKPGLVLLLGEAGAGKSFLSLQIALAVAQGGRFFGKQARKGKVLIFQFDMSELIVRNRILDLRKAGINTSGPIYTLHPEVSPKGMNILKPEDYKILKAAIAEVEPDLIIFDVLREMHNADEDNSSEMKPIGDAIMGLCEGSAGLILHHPKKIAWGADPKVVDASRGSSYLPGKVDAVWLLHDGYFHIGKSRFAPGGRHTVKRQSSGLWTFT